MPSTSKPPHPSEEAPREALATASPKLDICLRPYHSGDLATLHKIDMECFGKPFRYSLRGLQQFLEDGRAWAAVAEHPGGIAGFIVLHLHRTHSETFGYVVTLDVRASVRGRGIGRSLLLEAERSAQLQGANRMRLHVSADDSGAKSFYARLGYRQAAQVPSFYGENLDALLLRKSLV